KVESGVNYVARNALAGKRFASWDALNAWLREWATTIADQRVHGTTFEIPAVRFQRERLTPLDGRPPYAFGQVRTRRVATDALVSFAGARYSVPATLVGTRVTVREHAAAYSIWSGDTEVARHPRTAPHTVTMDAAHYAGLLRVDRSPLTQPPLHDPRYAAAGEVTVRDLAVYDEAAA